MPNENSSCLLTKLVFYDPVILPCKHVFEKEALDDYLKENESSICPDPNCTLTITDDNQIQPAAEIKKSIDSALKKGELQGKVQYLPRYHVFSLLTQSKPLSSEEIKLISDEIKNKPEFLPYFLSECISSRSETEIETCINKLIELNTFTEITINQSITEKKANRQENYSVSYLLLSTFEGREILRENQTLCTLIGEELLEDFLKQFIHDNTHEGTLYYLLYDDIGKKILTNHSRLKNIIMHNKELLSRKIISGEHEGKSLQDLYDALFPSVSTRPLPNVGFFSSTSSNKQPPKDYAYQGNKM